MHDFSLFFKADCQMSERDAVFAVAPSLPIAVCAASIFDHNRRRFSDIGDDSAQHAALIAKQTRTPGKAPPKRPPACASEGCGAYRCGQTARGRARKREEWPVEPKSAFSAAWQSSCSKTTRKASCGVATDKPLSRNGPSLNLNRKSPDMRISARDKRAAPPRTYINLPAELVSRWESVTSISP